MAKIKNGIIVSFSDTPQAQDDYLIFTEDTLLSLDIFNSYYNIVSLNSCI